ncbi:NERD domain-containing protein [Sedimentibacter sp. zth1]|uniref:nuclease-related domain-containing protein n=1 Tax=Sedimentibacter sp. zth1 TaxID=2816908 RepID=UPI001A91FECB|nr:nuclease-related domain-containing protein [Sedimentibacter sp. zth1]QSX05293.1 NERD domain-containing protein [Sedimentibacter sp. zth1]
MLPRYIRYRGSDYKEASGNSFFKTVLDKGNFGEFMTFSYLEKLDGHHKLMTNLYLFKDDGSTTEIDLIMLSQTGIYVFESKNYSGWIFGDEKNRNWTQTLQNKQKNRFFNPIWQNKGHISALKSVIDFRNDNLYKSYIIFSKRCTLKKINVISPDVRVIKRNVLINAIKKDIEGSSNILTVEEVDQLYSKLKKYTCADKAIKKAHVEKIKAKRS